MNTAQFKKIARILKDLYRDLELEALTNNISLTGEVFTQLQERVRNDLLKREGFTPKEYLDAKNAYLAEQAERRKGDQGAPGETPTDEKILELIRPLIPPAIPGEPGKTPTEEELLKIIKPLIPKPKEIKVEIPDERIKAVIKPIVDGIYNQFSVDVAYIDDKVNNIRFPLPETPDYEKWKEGFMKAAETFFQDNFSDNFKKNIDALGMPDFRRLAMGLQEQIDARIIGVNTDKLTVSATEPTNPQENDIWIDIS